VDPNFSPIRKINILGWLATPVFRWPESIKPNGRNLLSPKKRTKLIAEASYFCVPVQLPAHKTTLRGNPKKKTGENND
jgi:hypothetical protein